MNRWYLVLGGVLGLLTTVWLIPATCGPSSQNPVESPITTAEIRGRIDHHVCAAWLDDVELYEARFGDPRCAEPPDGSALAQAVAQGVSDAAVLVPLAADAYERAYAELEDPRGRGRDELDAVVRAVYWSDPRLGAAAMARVLHHLARAGLECVDCEALVPPSRTSLDWTAFEPHVLAHLWPHEGEARTEILVCSAVNGVEALGLSDARSIDTGFLAALALAEDSDTSLAIRAIVERNLPVDQTRIELGLLLDSPRARALVCSRIAATSWFTGVVVSDC